MKSLIPTQEIWIGLAERHTFALSPLYPYTSLINAMHYCSIQKTAFSQVFFWGGGYNLQKF